MSLNWADGVVQGTFIRFVVDYEHQAKRPLTERWYVLSHSHERIGIVKWFGRFRKYGFFPNANTAYEEVCMRELAVFCEELTAVRRRIREEEKELRQTLAERRLRKAEKEAVA